MHTRRKLALDYLLRTRELLSTSRMSLDDIAYLTGTSRPWLKDFSRCDDDTASKMDVSLVARIHDWLILTELAAEEPAWGPEDALAHLGETALYIYRHRQQPGHGGLLTQSERATIIRRAAIRLDALHNRQTFATR